MPQLLKLQHFGRHFAKKLLFGISLAIQMLQRYEKEYNLEIRKGAWFLTHLGSCFHIHHIIPSHVISKMQKK